MRPLLIFGCLASVLVMVSGSLALLGLWSSGR
jgi:hypothetical protein